MLVLSLIFERTTPIAGAGVIALFAVGIGRFGLFKMLDYVAFLGVGAYLMVRRAQGSTLQKYAKPALFAATGFSLCWLSMEKLIDPEWGLLLLRENPTLTLGLPAEFFLVGAAFVEFCLGFLLIIGLLSRPLALIIAVNLALAFVIVRSLPIDGRRTCGRCASRDADEDASRKPPAADGRRERRTDGSDKRRTCRRRGVGSRDRPNGITFSKADVGTPHQDGSGHVHLYVDGRSHGQVFSADAAAAKLDLEFTEDDLIYFEPLPARIDDGDTPSAIRLDLGRALYYEKQLSKAGDLSCNTCHLRDKFDVHGKKDALTRNGPAIGGRSYQRVGLVVPYQGRVGSTRFKVPSLRNIAKTAPYFHHGRYDRLEDVVRTMAWHQLGKSTDHSEIERIVAFLESLTGEIRRTTSTSDERSRAVTLTARIATVSYAGAPNPRPSLLARTFQSRTRI